MKQNFTKSIFVISFGVGLSLLLHTGSECSATEDAYSKQCSDDILPLSVAPAPRLISHEWMSLADWYQKHAQDIEEAEKGEAKIVLVGDSITEGWQWGEARQWNEVLAPMGTVNQGIGGDMTQNVLWRLDHGGVMNLKPERVICLIGTNNFGHTDENPEQVSWGVIAVVKKLKACWPDAKLLVFAVFPRGESPEDPDRAKIKELNERIKHVGEWENVTFLDIGERFLREDGRIPNEIMPDYLHLSPRGYDIWLQSILEWMESVPVERP